MKTALSIIISFALFVMIWWSITDLTDDTRIELETSKPYAEIYMNDFEITAMNEDGSPGYILSGKYLQKINESDDIEIEQPVFMMRQQENHWKVIADSAIVNDKKETILLTDNIIMQQQNVDPAVTIRTSDLLINTKTQVAQTRARVDISNGISQIESDGMIYNNISSDLELSSNVSGYYVPND